MDAQTAKEVLIVDANGNSRRLLRQIFALLGFSHVTCTNSTSQAITLLRDKCFHIVFCDESSSPAMPNPILQENLQITGKAASA